MAEKLYTFG